MNIIFKDTVRLDRPTIDVFLEGAKRGNIIYDKNLGGWLYYPDHRFDNPGPLFRSAEKVKEYVTLELCKPEDAN